MNALAALRAELFGALIGLARATFGNEDLITPSTFAVVVEGLSSFDLDADQMSDLIRRVNEEKYKLVPSCFYCSSPCGRTSNYDMCQLNLAAEDVRLLKLSILSKLSALAGSNLSSLPTEAMVYRALAAVGEDWTVEELTNLLNNDLD
ncbi:MAG: hypothetical protein IJN10_01590 [Firmicutes bacterium]|nr:hypothetical protein [Bacillota bacterium]